MDDFYNFDVFSTGVYQDFLSAIFFFLKKFFLLFHLKQLFLLKNQKISFLFHLKFLVLVNLILLLLYIDL